MFTVRRVLSLLIRLTSEFLEIKKKQYQPYCKRKFYVKKLLIESLTLQYEEQSADIIIIKKYIWASVD